MKAMKVSCKNFAKIRIGNIFVEWKRFNIDYLAIQQRWFKAHHDNPYDGATLKECLRKAEEHSEGKIEQAFADKAYRGKEHHPDDVKIYISGKKNLPPPLKKLLKGRSGIEPIIGHLKQEHRLDRNYLLGKIGDKINAILAGCGFNLRKILNCIKLDQSSLA
jgi:hypothetical protein